MNIDSIKSKPSNKSQPSVKRGKDKLKKTANNTAARQEANRKKMWGLTAVALVLIVGLWIVSLKVNIERINKAQSTKEATYDLSELKSKFNAVFKQSSQFIDNINLNTSTVQVINDSEKPTTTDTELTEKQIKELSETLKSLIPTTTEATQP